MTIILDIVKGIIVKQGMMILVRLFTQIGDYDGR